MCIRDRYAILTNGAQIQNAVTGEVIERRALDWQKAVQIIDKISGYTLKMCIRDRPW